MLRNTMLTQIIITFCGKEPRMKLKYSLPTWYNLRRLSKNHRCNRH